MIDMSTTLDDDDIHNAIHLLLIGTTKVGKSTYAADAAIAGFRVLYIDADNGTSALKYRLKDHPEARKRVHVVPTSRPAAFMTAFFQVKKGRLVWNQKLDYQYTASLKNQFPDDPAIVLTPSNMPKDLVIVLDSWTALSTNALEMGATNNGVEMIDMKDAMQSVYGDANVRATVVANGIQKHQSHWIVIAHDTFYERWEKPDGATGRIKQNEMILQETIQIPSSTSRPHGYSMASRFNYIGWLVLDRAGRVNLDFTRRPDRIGGGPPNTKELVNKLQMADLVGSVPTDPGESADWIRKTTIEEFLPVSKTKKDAVAPQAAATPAKPVAANPTSAAAGDAVTSRPQGIMNLNKLAKAKGK